MARIDVESLSRELVRALRGKRSQPAMSRALGFSSNVVYTWESGRRSPEASVFFAAARQRRFPVRQQVLEFLKDYPPVLAEMAFISPRAVQHIVKHLVGRAPKSELAQRLGVDRGTLARWLGGKTEPRLPELLNLIDVSTQRLLEFVALFADPSKLASTRGAYEDLVVQQRLAYDMPWSHAILRALELDDYRKLHCHQPGFLAERIGISRQDEDNYLRELSEARQIHWTGTHWQVAHVLTVDTGANPAQNLKLKAHWASAALERIGQAPADALFSFNLFAIAEESFQTIRELHLAYYDRVRGIIEQSPSADRVVLMNLQLVPLELAECATHHPLP